MSKKKNYLISISITLVAVFFMLLGGEVFYHFTLQKRIILDDYLGWRPNPNYAYSGERVRLDHSAEVISVSFQEKGFRMYGDVNTTRPKVLFIGDSFTQAVDASDDKTYYAQIGQALDVEVFAYGVRGFGTFQEYLLIDEIFDEIQPDLLVWQLCENDFLDNSFEMQYRSRSVYLRRPFLEGDEIVYRYPGIYPEWFYHSVLLSYWAPKVYSFFYGQHPIDQNYTPEAYQVTRRTFRMVGERVGDIPVITFNARENFSQEFDQFSVENGFHFIGSVHPTLYQQGLAAFDRDGGHWSHLGHAIVKDILTPHIAEVLVVPIRKQSF